MSPDIFERNVPGMTERLTRACVGIAGCGGLGSNVAVALVRAGVGHLVIADDDHVVASNLNRQHFFIRDIGKEKAPALAEYLLAINPEIGLHVETRRITPQNLSDIFGHVDILVEAVDRGETKQWMIHEWHRLYPEKPLIVGNGIAGYGQTGTLRIERMGTIYFCGDMTTDQTMGLAAPRVLIAAAMQANLAVELLMEGGHNDHHQQP